MKTRLLAKREVVAEPFRVWNAYIDLLGMEDYHDLTPEQRPAHLVFWYESEVQNGGHLQYFENHGTKHLAETIESLGILGASCQQQILKQAGEQWRASEREPIQTTEEYCEVAFEGEFDDLDSRFYDCPCDLRQCLESFLDQHQSWFVTIT